jgi:hypothetical protein
MKKKICQEWDSNPRPLMRTRMPRTQLSVEKERMCLESGALDRSAILTLDDI